jgi:serine/threonine-protein kinase RsbW
MASVVRMELPADLHHVRVVTACATELLAARRPRQVRDEQDILLALQEACMNVIDHAYQGREGGRLGLDFTLDDDAFIAELSDQGASFDPSSVPTPDFGNGQVRGYGLFLMRTLVDELGYSSSNGTNRLRLVKRFA